MEDISNEVEKKKRGRPRTEPSEPKEPKEFKKPGRPKTENPKTLTKEYYREFYHANKKECECEVCKMKFVSRSGLLNHQKTNKSCLIMQLFKKGDENVNAIDTRVANKYKSLLDRNINSTETERATSDGNSE